MDQISTTVSDLVKKVDLEKIGESLKTELEQIQSKLEQIESLSDGSPSKTYMVKICTKLLQSLALILYQKCT